MVIRQRTFRVWLALGFGLFCASGAVLLSLVLIDSVRDELPTALLLVPIAGLAGVAVLACLPWWRRLDEMEQGAHLLGWYWGGTLGALAGLIGLVAIHGGQSLVVRGAVLVLIIQLITYLLFWLGIRVSRRAPDA